MACTLKILVTLALFGAAAASSCEGGKCNVADEVNLMQVSAVPVTKTISKHEPAPEESSAPAEEDSAPEEKEEEKEGEESPAPEEEAPKEPKSEPEESKSKLEDDAVKAEAFTLDETATGGATPAGCMDMGCQGSGPACGGNSFDCTSHGFVVTGWYKTCNHADTCATGWKVRCAKCHSGSTATSVAMPAPSASPTLWAAPAPGPTAAPATTVAPHHIHMPTDAPTYVAPKYDNTSVKHHTHNLKAAIANLTLFKVALANASAIEKKVHANITKFEQLATKAEGEFNTNRDTAVRYAKKVALANITVWKAQKAMANAYYAEKGAAQAAQSELTKANNAAAERRYFEKLVVDKAHEVTEAEHLLKIGNEAVEKAKSDLAAAKKAAEEYHHHMHKHDQDKMDFAEKLQKLAMKEAVEKTAQDAYIESSGGVRNSSNVPPMEFAGAAV